MSLVIPGITWRGIRDAATQELAVCVDASWMSALKLKDPTQWWLPLLLEVPSDASTEATRLPIDFEDLGEWKEDVGPAVAKGAKPLTSVLIPRKPWKKSRRIATADIRRNAFAGWPDRLTAMMLSSRRMMGVIVRELLFQATTKALTYQGIPLIGAGHLCDPTDPDGATFNNLHTATNFDTPGWEAAQDAVFGRIGPGGFGLDMGINFVLGGSKMRKKFDRIFKRILVLDETSTAAVTNIHSEMIEGGTIPIITSWLDQHPWLLANTGKDQWWTISTTYPARPFGIVAENGGAPAISILDIGSEYEIENDEILIKGKMAMNGAAAFPQTIDEWRGS